MLSASTPTISQFNPYDVPYQARVLKDLRKNFDYSNGATHELLLSGSVGCLREDTLIDTAFGQVPIGDIKQSMHLLSFDHSSGRYCFAQGSDAFPKGKDYLYRVITKHGEFLASGHHHILSSQNTYKPVSLLAQSCEEQLTLSGHQMIYPSYGQRLLLSGVLSSWRTISSFLYHCVEYIHQCDPQLQSELDIVRDVFPLQDDAQRSNLFFYQNKLLRKDDLEGLLLRHGPAYQLHAHQSMRDFLSQLLHHQTALASDVLDSKLLKHMFDGIQRFQLSQMNSVHPRALLYFVSKFCKVLSECVSYEVINTPDSAVVAIEKTERQEWYWDIQVPNTNNYLSNGLVHHNSAKSLLCAHIVITHCLFNRGARVLIGRESMKDLKNTILKKILEHIGDEIEYDFNKTTGQITLTNGSEIIPYSWGDQKITKVRSLELSAAMIEELTENEDMGFYKEIRARVGRLPHIKESFIISATNPGGKSSEFYQYFIEPGGPRRHVYYSVTTDNKFLEKGYIEGLLDSYDEKTAQRMIYGQWIDFNTEIVYHAYSREFNYIDGSYSIKKNLPIILAFDFNIGLGKPLSCALIQYDQGAHVFNEVVVDGQDTYDAMNELFNRGLLSHNTQYIVHGDAAGRSRDTRSKKTDYLIIEEFLKEKKISHKIDVPSKNPLVRDRHNLANGLICNSKGERKLFVYKDAPTADKGFTSTRLKKGSQYLEEDSDRWQHISTAITYSLCQWLRNESSQENQVQNLNRFGRLT